MTNRPDDLIDPYESRLTRRVGAFAEQAVRPIDATAIASIAAAGARRRTLAGRLFGSTSSTARLGVVVAGAILLVSLGAVLGAGGLKVGPSQTAAASGPEATPTSVPGAVEACAPEGLSGEITAWEGAAGHRIATIVVRNSGSSACSLPTLLSPALVDGDGHALIMGAPAAASASITLGTPDTATAMVDMTNYCGAAPSSPLGILLYLPSRILRFELVPGPGVRLPIDPPPCNGPSQPASIEMQPLQLTAGQ
jgi:hypothetical protein